MFGLARRELAKSRPSVVVATGPPFHDFIAGYFSSKWAGASLILDYRDEWTQCPFDFVAKGGANAVWERRCLSAADHVIFTTDSQRKRLNRLYGVGLTAKSEVIPNGWEPGDFEGSPLNPENRETWPLTLMFAGKLGGHTDPQRFLAALTRLLERKPEWRDQLRVRLVGPKLDSVAALLAQFPYPQVLQDVPLVPREEAAALMKSADALLLFHDARFERYLPGKLFEYMAAHKPILVVDDIGETRRLVESLEAGCAIDSSDIDALEAVFAQLATRTLWSRNEKRDEWLSRHTRERLTGRFLTLFDRAQ